MVMEEDEDGGGTHNNQMKGTRMEEDQGVRGGWRHTQQSNEGEKGGGIYGEKGDVRGRRIEAYEEEDRGVRGGWRRRTGMDGGMMQQTMAATANKNA